MALPCAQIAESSPLAAKNEFIRSWPHPSHGSWTWTHRSQLSKRHRDRFISYCTAHPCAKHRHTDTRTTLRATSDAI